MELAPGAGQPFAVLQANVMGMFHAMKHLLVGGRPLISRTIRCSQPEGFIAGPLGAVQERHGACTLLTT